MRLDSLSDDSWLSGGFRSLGVSVQKCQLNRARREGLARVKKQKKAAALRKIFEQERSRKKLKKNKTSDCAPPPQTAPPTTAEVQSACDAGTTFTSKFLGVYFRGHGSFRARVHARGRDVSLGGFRDERSAAEERDKAVMLMQLNTRLNFPGREYTMEEMNTTKVFLENRGLRVEGELPLTSKDMKMKYKSLGSKYVGVAFCCKRKMFMARVIIKGRSPAIIGYYGNEEDAARAHDIALMHFDYHKCKRNFPDARYTYHQIEEVKALLGHCEIPSSMTLHYTPIIKAYQVSITIGVEKIGLGTFKGKEEAARAFDLASLSLTGGNPVHLNYFGHTYDLVEVENYRQKLKTELGSKRFEELKLTFCREHSLGSVSKLLPGQKEPCALPNKLYGIMWDEEREEWKVEIKHRVCRGVYRVLCIGHYSDAIEAARAHDLAVIAARDAVYEPLNFSQFVYGCEEVCDMKKKVEGILCEMDVFREKESPEYRFKDYINQVLSRTGTAPMRGDEDPQPRAGSHTPRSELDAMGGMLQEESLTKDHSEGEAIDFKAEECVHGEGHSVNLSASDILFCEKVAAHNSAFSGAELGSGEKGAKRVKSDPESDMGTKFSLAEDIDPINWGELPAVKVENEEESLGLAWLNWVPNFVKKETESVAFGGDGGLRAREGFVKGVASSDRGDLIPGIGNSAVVKSEGAMIHSQADIAPESMIH